MTQDELAAMVKQIRAEWEAKAKAGDRRAAQLLRECYGDAVPEKVDVPTPGPTVHWQEKAEEREREPGEEG